MSFRSGLVAAALASLLAATAAVAQPDLEERLEEFSAVSLEPGQYRWTPQASTSGSVEIVVSITLQLAYVFRGGVMIGVASVSSGSPGHDTPTGTFEILQKNRDHRSNIYSNAPMPFMQRLTWDGIALHAGHNPGYPDSHGCIRLPMAFARELFAVTRLGVAVHVTDEAPTPLEAVSMLRSRGATAARD